MDNNLDYFCPQTGGILELINQEYVSKNKIIYKIKNNIPRFCDEESYVDNFGMQWNKFAKTQLDSYSGSNLSKKRFWAQTNWEPSSLEKLNVLEVGSGAGRFSEVFLESTKGKLYSIDYSSAVDANLKNNKRFGSRLVLSQASIYAMPFRDNTFDKIFCFGVLQHTPSFQQSVNALVNKLKINGEIVVDFYPIKGFYTKIHSKYLLRPITKKLPKDTLLNLITKSVPIFLLIIDFLAKLKLDFLIRFLPITDVRSFPKNLSKFERTRWAILDTFDAFSPEYDNPQKLNNVIQMFKAVGCQIKFAGKVSFDGGSSMVIRAIKKEFK